MNKALQIKILKELARERDMSVNEFRDEILNEAILKLCVAEVNNKRIRRMGLVRDMEDEDLYEGYE